MDDMKAEIAEKYLKKQFPEKWRHLNGWKQMMMDAMEEYHRSQLQALKEDLKNSKKRWAEWSNAFPATSYRTHEADGAIKEIDRILKSDLITNLEDNG